MFAFFNQKNEWRWVGQIANVAALALATLDLVNHPEKALELIPDLASHGLNFYALTEESDPCLDFFTAGLNMVRLGAIYSGVALGGSSVPLALNLIDAANHLFTAGVLILSCDNDENERRVLVIKNN